MTEHEYEAVGTTHPGDRVLRVYRKPKKTLPTPRLSTVLQVSKRVALETPFLAMLPVIAVLLLAFSTGLYFAEVHATGSGIGSYGDALWDGVVLMTTAGTMTEPVTTAGHVVGAIWTIIGCLLFYGTIIASASAYFLLPVTSYFLLPHRSKQAHIVSTIQYNLSVMEDLTVDELEILKEETVSVINAQIKCAHGGGEQSKS